MSHTFALLDLLLYFIIGIRQGLWVKRGGSECRTFRCFEVRYLIVIFYGCVVPMAHGFRYTHAPGVSPELSCVLLCRCLHRFQQKERVVSKKKKVDLDEKGQPYSGMNNEHNDQFPLNFKIDMPPHFSHAHPATHIPNLNLMALT
jgi:hypothetical protein